MRPRKHCEWLRVNEWMNTYCKKATHLDKMISFAPFSHYLHMVIWYIVIIWKTLNSILSWQHGGSIWYLWVQRAWLIDGWFRHLEKKRVNKEIQAWTMVSSYVWLVCTVKTFNFTHKQKNLERLSEIYKNQWPQL